MWVGTGVDGAADASSARGQAVSGIQHAEKLDQGSEGGGKGSARRNIKEVETGQFGN